MKPEVQVVGIISGEESDCDFDAQCRSVSPSQIGMLIAVRQTDGL